MATVDTTITTSGVREETSGLEAQLAVKQDSVTKIVTPCVQATGVTFNGTLDPTNLAVETGNLQQLREVLAITIGTVQKVAVGAAHAESAVLGSTLVLLVSDVACHIVISDTPVAAATSFYLPANTPMSFVCTATNKVSVLQTTGAGNIYITPLN